MAELKIERGRKWAIAELEFRTIGLDGAIAGPYVDADNEIFSFDHHENCIRGITLSSCEQARDFLLLGLDPEDYTILLNDIDLDSALSAWLLTNPSRVTEPLVEKLVHMAGRQDCHVGAYPVKDSGLLDWIAEPESKMRADGSYEGLTNECLSFLLEAIWRRIEQYADGRQPDLARWRDANSENYEVAKRGTNWSLVRLIGERPYRGLAKANINRWVGFRDLEDGTLCVTIGKRSEVTTGFPVGPADKEGTILHVLNKLEPGWGGSTTVGGSPKNKDGSGTKLTVDQIFDVVECIVKAIAKKKQEEEEKQ